MRLQIGAKECIVYISARVFQRVFTCKIWLRYSRTSPVPSVFEDSPVYQPASRERALQSLDERVRDRPKSGEDMAGTPEARRPQGAAHKPAACRLCRPSIRLGSARQKEPSIRLLSRLVLGSFPILMEGAKKNRCQPYCFIVSSKDGEHT